MKNSPGSTNHNNMLVILAGIVLNNEKVVSTFSRFNPCLSLPSFAPDDRKQFQCLNIVLKNKTGPLFLGANCTVLRRKQIEWDDPFIKEE